VAGAAIDAGSQVSVAVLGALVIGRITRTHACLVIGIAFAGTFLLLIEPGTCLVEFSLGSYNKKELQRFHLEWKICD